jgi:hypothetical protein
VAAGRKPSRAYPGTGPAAQEAAGIRGKPDDRVRLPAPPSGREADRRSLLASVQPRHAAAAAVPLRHRETQGRRAAPRLARAIGASGQLPEDWPSSGHVHRRVARYARSLQEAAPANQDIRAARDNASEPALTPLSNQALAHSSPHSAP